MTDCSPFEPGFFPDWVGRLADQHRLGDLGGALLQQHAHRLADCQFAFFLPAEDLGVLANPDIDRGRLVACLRFRQREGEALAVGGQRLDGPGEEGFLAGLRSRLLLPRASAIDLLLKTTPEAASWVPGFIQTRAK